MHDYHELYHPVLDYGRVDSAEISQMVSLLDVIFAKNALTTVCI